MCSVKLRSLELKDLAWHGWGLGTGMEWWVGPSKVCCPACVCPALCRGPGLGGKQLEGQPLRLCCPPCYGHRLTRERHGCVGPGLQVSTWQALHQGRGDLQDHQAVPPAVEWEDPRPCPPCHPWGPRLMLEQTQLHRTPQRTARTSWNARAWQSG